MARNQLPSIQAGTLSIALFSAIFSAHAAFTNNVDTEELSDKIAENDTITSQNITAEPLNAQDNQIRSDMRDTVWNYASFVMQIIPDSENWRHLATQKQKFEESGLSNMQVFDEMKIYTNSYIRDNAQTATAELPDTFRTVFDKTFQSIINIHYAEEDTLQKTSTMAESVLQRFTRMVASKFMLDNPELTNVDDITEMMLEGMLSSLDEHSRYLDPDAWQKMQAQLFTTESADLGIELRRNQGKIFVYHVKEDSPAADAHIQAGMVITGIDEWVKDADRWKYTDFSEMNLMNAHAVLSGDVGSNVRLHVEGEKIDEFILTRSMLPNNPVEVACVDNEFSHIRLHSFSENAHKILEETVENIQEFGGCADTSRYYLDLRNNFGGSLISTLGINDSFLDEGLILFDDLKGTENDTIYSATPGGVFQGKNGEPDAKLTVIINSKSASGSEIVAGNLQAHGRGDVVGMQGYGKGSAQTVISLPNGGAAIITKSLFMTAAGYTHDHSIIPNLLVEGARFETPLMPRERGPGVNTGLSNSLLSQNLPTATCSVKQEFFTAAEMDANDWDPGIFHRTRLSEAPDSYISVFGSYVQAYGADNYVLDAPLVCHIVSNNPDSRYARLVTVKSRTDSTPNLFHH